MVVVALVVVVVVVVLLLLLLLVLVLVLAVLVELLELAVAAIYTTRIRTSFSCIGKKKGLQNVSKVVLWACGVHKQGTRILLYRHYKAGSKT